MAMIDRRIGGAARRSRKRLRLGLIEVASRMAIPWRKLDDLERGRLVRLFDVAIEDAFAYYLTWHHGAPLSPAGATFRDWLRAEIATLQSGKPAAGALRQKRA